MDFSNFSHVNIPAEDETGEFCVKDGTFKAKLNNGPKVSLAEMNNYTYSANLVVADPYIEKPKVQDALYMQKKRAELSEVERERRKAQVDIVEIDDNGYVTVRTSNTIKEYKERKFCNFYNPILTVYCHERCRVYSICFWINNQKKIVFVHEADAGDGKLLLKKFNSVGADFLMDRVSKKINATLQLLALLLRNVSEEIILPPEPGWYTDLSGRMRFCKEDELSWEIIMTHI